MVLVDQGPADIYRLLNDAREINPFLTQLEAVACDAAKIEEIVEQPADLAYLLVDDVTTPLQLRVGDVHPLENRGGVPNGRKRIAQLVRKRGEKIVLAPIDDFQLFHPLLEFLLESLARGDICEGDGISDAFQILLALK